MKQLTWIIIGVIVIMVFSMQGKKEAPTVVNFLWNNLNTTAGFSGSGSGDRGCASWDGSVSPHIDTNSPITISSSTSWGSCSGLSGNANLAIKISNPKSYKQIFIESSGNVNAGGSISSNCASASASASVSQSGGNGVTLFSESISCQGSKSLPSNVLLNIDGDFVSIPSALSSFKLTENNDLIITFGTGTSNCCTGRSSSSNINLNSITLIPEEPQIDCPVLESNAISSIQQWALNPIVDNRNNAINAITRWAIAC